MDKVTLYAVDKKGGVKEWSIETVGPIILVSHGKMGGKMQLKTFTAKPKNVGRSNETTAEKQAKLEMVSRINKQYDKCYRLTIDEAKAAHEEELLPMLASDYTKVGHSIIYPCFASPKLDGVRCIARIGDKNQVTLTSRGGKEYPVPGHIRKQLISLKAFSRIDTFDGELYVHGVSLQNIVSAVKKPNELTPKLEFWIFDVPSEDAFKYRNTRLESLQNTIRYKKEDYKQIRIVLNETALNEEHAREFMDEWLKQGFEGMMLRNIDGMYEWNHRSRDLQKWKDFKDDEFLVIGYEVDALGEAVYHLKHEHYIKGVKREFFKAKPRGNHEYRSASNSKTFLKNWVTVRYQQLTDAGVPQFPVIVAVRECDDEGNPVE